MFSNYKYFLAIAEELNLRRASDRLYVSHQNLSKYLQRLEALLGVRLCNRRPVFSLTPEGELLASALRDTELTEQGFRAKLADMIDEAAHEIRLGTTEGRFRILIPDLLGEFHRDFPSVQLRITSADSPRLCSMLENNQLDIIIANASETYPKSFACSEVLNEHLYLVISDNMLREYFPDSYPECKETFRAGADIRDFQEVPFSLNLPGFRSHVMIMTHAKKHNADLKCIHVSSHPDLHHIMSARDYAASVCLTMYLPKLLKLNEESGGILNVFPIKDLAETNPVVVAWLRKRTLSKYTVEFIELVRRQCITYAKYDKLFLP